MYDSFLLKRTGFGQSNELLSDGVVAGRRTLCVLEATIDGQLLIVDLYKARQCVIESEKSFASSYHLDRLLE